MGQRPPIKATIVEQYVQSKTGNPKDCEDRIHVSESFVAVIDGATAKTDDRWENQTGGQKAAEFIDATLHQIPRDCTARQCVDMFTSTIRAFYVKENLTASVESHPERRISASVVILNLFKQEIWSIGDCQFMLDTRRYAPKKKVDVVAEEARAFFLAAELLSQRVTIEDLRRHDIGREFIRPLLERQARFQNNLNAGAFYYAAVDGFRVPDSGILVEPIPDDTPTIILASDGYSILAQSLEASEQSLAALLRHDPLLYKDYKSTKGLVAGNVSFDDRAYVKVKLCR